MRVEEVIDSVLEGATSISDAVDSLLEIRGYTPWSSQGVGSRGKSYLHHALFQRKGGLSQTGDRKVFKFDDKQSARRSNPTYRKERRQQQEKQQAPSK